MRTPLTHKILQKEDYVEVQATGSGSPWDFLKVIHKLKKLDPKKEKPDLWVLSQDLDITLYSFSPIVQGILALVTRLAIKRGCKSAILASDEFQKAKIELYCMEASALPFEIRAFTARDEALIWLLN